jgi:addiction module RelE/StbE family toxin
MSRVEIIYAQSFIRDAQRLPRDAQERLQEQVERFRANPLDPRLHAKALHGRLEGYSSFRITRNYRALYRWSGQAVYILLAVDDRKDVYR